MFDAIFFKLEEKLILIGRNSYVLFYYIVPLSIQPRICMNLFSSQERGMKTTSFSFYILLNPEGKKDK